MADQPGNTDRGNVGGAGERGLQRGRRAVEWNMRNVDIGAELQQLDRELRDAAETGRGISELARIGFCFRDQIGDADDARGRPGDDGVGRSAEIGNRRKIPERVVSDFSDARIDQHHNGYDHEGVTVGHGARAGGKPNIADRTDAVLDNDALPQFRRQLGGQQPAEQIIGPAGGKRDDDGDGALGPSGARVACR